jgi:hypothetical protein
LADPKNTAVEVKRKWQKYSLGQRRGLGCGAGKGVIHQPR